MHQPVGTSSPPRRDTSNESDWARRRDAALAILGWFVVVAVALWIAAHIIGALLVLTVAALLAYALLPAVRLLSNWVPRPLAIAVVYLAAMSALGLLGYLMVTAVAAQATSLANYAARMLGPGKDNVITPLLAQLQQLGISRAQVQAAGDQIIAQAQGVVQSVVPLVESVFTGVLNTILVTVLSVYLLIDGQRVVQWLRTAPPLNYRARVTFILHTLERVVGGYIRGQLILCSLVGLLVGIGMAVLQVPYAALLGLLAFILEFIPILGVFVSGALCVLVALSAKGLVWALIVLAYFILVHVIEGDWVGPRIVGRAVGVHPAVSIFALLAGAELFGIWGALFASPVAGLIQAVLAEVWREWRDTHASQFSEESDVPGMPATASTTVPAIGVAHAYAHEPASIEAGEDTGATRAATSTSHRTSPHP